MEKQLVSSYRASVLLQRDRQTVERAVRALVPDRIDQRGRRQWFLSRIVAALAVKPRARRESGRCRDKYRIADRALDEMIVAFEVKVAQLAAEPSLDRRRELAIELAPQINELHARYLDAGQALRIDEVALDARGDLVWAEMLAELTEAAQWPRNEFTPEMMRAVWPSVDDDDDAG